MLDMAFGLSETSRLGCQVKLTNELDGMSASLPAATRNMFVDGAMHFFCQIICTSHSLSREEACSSLIEYVPINTSFRTGANVSGEVHYRLRVPKPPRHLASTALGTSGASDCPVLRIRLVLGDDRWLATPGGA
jgi:hypothetical protein